MILVVDNYDSFVFNLSRYIEELGYEVLIVRNNKITIEDICKLQPTHIIISPGPCGPKEAGMSVRIVYEFFKKIPILGICLGHQVIGHVFGGHVIKAKKPMHGRSCLIQHDGQGIFTSIASPLKIGRYHSLIVCDKMLSPELNITSRSSEGEIMSFSSKKLKLVGFQFHPESILTDHGHTLINNFINGLI